MVELARHFGFAVLLTVLLLGAATNASAQAPISVFERPALSELLQVAVLNLRAGQIKTADTLLRQIIARYPQMPLAYYLHASLLSRSGKKAEALGRLEAAVTNGFTGGNRLAQDPNLAALRSEARFKQLVARSATSKPDAPTTVSPSLVSKNIAMVSEANSVWDAKLNAIQVFRQASKLPATRTVRGTKDAVATLLNRLYGQKQAAGNHGDLYDNRDGDHSNLQPEHFKQLAFVEYSEPAKKAGLHFGFNRSLVFNAITMGNSSTVPRHLLSHGRLALSDPRFVARLFQQYVGNHIYVYPEDNDHDPKRGDRFPANTPYMIISQGSSGSDHPFLQAIGAVLAAFQPKVKDYLREQRLVMPTVQMILRRSQKSIAGDDAYLSGKAHPSVFEESEIDVLRAIKLANKLRIGEIPPFVHLTVVEESNP
ncbi:MAG: hypothetical protein O3A21_06795, partial [Proteobacteria bacterium]|nr:hypothetical protein [Pseudomonadota bacterium]